MPESGWDANIGWRGCRGRAAFCEVGTGERAGTGTDPGLPAWGSYSARWARGRRGACGMTPPPRWGGTAREEVAAAGFEYHGLRDAQSGVAPPLPAWLQPGVPLGRKAAKTGRRYPRG